MNKHVLGAAGTQSYAAANPLNQYPSVAAIGGGLTALSYDLNGNLTGDGVSTYSYDALNRLLSVTGSDEIGEFTSTGALLRRYIPGPGPDERAAMIDNGTTAPPLTALSIPHADRLGSVYSVTDSTGAVTQRMSYDVWGASASASSGYPFRFTGQRIDPETGLMFYKARTYSSALERFLLTDPRCG